MPRTTKIDPKHRLRADVTVQHPFEPVRLFGVAVTPHPLVPGRTRYACRACGRTAWSEPGTGLGCLACGGAEMQPAE